MKWDVKKFYIPCFFIYGLLILRFKISAITESISNITNGAVYPLVEIRRLFDIFAINDANIRLKFVIE